MMSANRLNMILLSGSLLILGAGGCRNDIAWCETQKISPDGWLPSDIVEFNLDPAAYEPKPENRFAEITARAVGDTLPRWLGTYRATLAVRFLDYCNVSTLDLVAEKAGLDEPIVADTISIPLYNNDGNAVGNGRFGISEAKYEIRNFTIADGTTFSLRPIDYSDTIVGISDITLLLHKQ